MSNDPDNSNTKPQPVLVDGSAPASPDQVLAALRKLDIKQSTISHQPMRTVEQSKEFRPREPGGYPKNFFLKNKKGKMWLVTLHEDRVIDLRTLGEMLGAGRVSFASEDRLMKYLGVIPGAVTPLAVINDVTQSVTAVLDEYLLNMHPLHFHPCDNSKTTTIDREGLLVYMSEFGHKPVILDFDQLGTQ